MIQVGGRYVSIDAIFAVVAVSCRRAHACWQCVRAPKSATCHVSSATVVPLAAKLENAPGVEAQPPSITETRKEVITASLDKTMAFWRLKVCHPLRCTRYAILHTPLHSSTTPTHLPSPASSTQALSRCCDLYRLAPPFFPFAKTAGMTGATTASRCFVATWAARSSHGSLVTKPCRSRYDHSDDHSCYGSYNNTPQVVLDGHSGWVRALAKHKKWLFSASCNKLRQYDMTRAVPSLVREVTLDKGDILSLAAAGDRLFAAGADGSLWCVPYALFLCSRPCTRGSYIHRSWLITKTGDLVETTHRAKAHGDRATVVRAHGTMLFSASYDGSVKMWDAATMELIEHVDKAHDGQRVTCLAVGPNGLVYTGGDDKLIRRWNRTDLEQYDPLYCHNHSIRTLNAGKTELLMAGDAGGEVSLWRV